MWFQGSTVFHRFAPESRVQRGWVALSRLQPTTQLQWGPLSHQWGDDSQQASNRVGMVRLPGAKGLVSGPSSSSVLILGSCVAFRAVTASPGKRNEKRKGAGGKGNVYLRNGKQENRTTIWPYLGIFLKKMKTLTWKDTCSLMPTAALFTIAKI